MLDILLNIKGFSFTKTKLNVKLQMVHKRMH